MNNTIKILVAAFVVTLFTGCYDRDVFDSKEFNHSLPDVESLDYTKKDNNVTLTWKIPSSVSADFRKPLSVQVQVVENNINRQKITVENESTSVDIVADPAKKYYFIVKLQGFIKTEVRKDGEPERVLSAGRIVVLQ
jgi:hypothetical protein